MRDDLLSRRQSLQALAALGVLASPLAAKAQSTWPTKPVNLIVPFPAGGGTDAFARPMSAQLPSRPLCTPSSSTSSSAIWCR